MRIIFISLYSLTILILPLKSIGQSQNKSSIKWEKEIDEYVSDVMSDWHIPGLALTVVENNEILLMKGYGVTDIETQVPVNPESTVFHVGSISKPITATAVLNLYDRGQLSLDREIDQFFEVPFFENLYDHYPTTAQLLVHAGGFDVRTINRYSKRADAILPLEDYLRKNMPPIIHPPGAISIYSNHGYALLGHIVSKISKQRFASYMKDHIFDPLEMKKSSFDIKPNKDKEVATGYGFGPNAGNKVDPIYIKTVPASMLKTTAVDISHWMIAILNDGSFQGKEILKPSTNKTLLTRQYSNHPLIPGRSFGLSESSRFSPPEFLHSGVVPGFTSVLVLVPEIKFGLFITANTNAYLWGIANRILDQIESNLGSADPVTKVFEQVDSSNFEGYYRAAGIPQNSMFKFGNWIRQTHISSLPDGKVEWEGSTYSPVDSLAFQKEGNESIVAFKKKEGKINYLFAGGDEYVKIPWFQNTILQGVIFTLFLLTFLVIVLRWGFIPVFNKEKSFESRKWPITIITVASAINFIFLVSIIYLAIVELGDKNILIYGVPIWFKIIKILVWISFALSIGILIGSILSWKQKYWKMKKRLTYSLLTSVLLFFIPYVFYWNLLG